MVMTAEEKRRLRLKNEYEAIQRIPEDNGIYTVTPSPGETPPYVSSYDVTFTIPTYVNSGNSIQQCTVVRVRLSDGFPMDQPMSKVIKGDIPFHVNIWDNGMISSGSIWNLRMWLYEYFGFIGKTLQFQPSMVDVRSPCNRAAIPFFNAHKDIDLPTDNRPMPVLSSLSPMMDVQICFPDGRRPVFRVPPETLVDDLLKALMEAGIITRAEYIVPDYLTLFSASSASEIDRSKSLTENNVKDNDSLNLFISAHAPAYRSIPSSDEERISKIGICIELPIPAFIYAEVSPQILCEDVIEYLMEDRSIEPSPWPARIKVLLPNGECLNASVDANLLEKDVANRLLNSGAIEPRPTCQYILCLKRDEIITKMDQSNSLAENNVKDGDYLVVVKLNSQLMHFTLKLPNGRDVDIEADSETTCDELIEQLIEQYVIPPVHFDYLLSVGEFDGPLLDLSKSLAENGVKENDNVYLRYPG